VYEFQRGFTVSLLKHPILVVSYADDIRATLVLVLNNNGVDAVACSTFCEAESLALLGSYSGMLVDLASIVKSKGEEKIIAYTLASFFPTLRVRSFGRALVPMSMSGSSKQDKSLNDFLNVTCRSFEPRQLRAFRRHPVSLSTMLHYKGEECRGFTLNLSWAGAFIVDFNAERFAAGDIVNLRFPEFNCAVQTEICWKQPWGMRCAPGVGVRFTEFGEQFETVFSNLLKSWKEFDRDILVG